MERDKSDKYAFAVTPSQPQKHSLTGYKVVSQDPQHMKEQMFLKYASSIIQVINQDKLQKSNPNISQGDYQNAVIEISEVKGYGTDYAGGNRGDRLQQQKKYNLQVDYFKKKQPNHNNFSYAIMNIDSLVCVFNKLMNGRIETAFQSVKNSKKMQKKQVSKWKKQRSSVNSRSTSYTCIDEFRSRRTLQTQKRLYNLEQMKEGANAIKGWIEFKVLILQSSILKDLLNLPKSKPKASKVEDISPIKASRGELNFSEKFCLTQYQNDDYLAIDAHLHHLEESLEYTADPQCESGKEQTMTTPEKVSTNGEVRQKYQRSVNPSNEPRESIVSPYKAYLKGSKAMGRSQIGEKKVVSIAESINLSSEQRRYLTIRTNVFQLPLVSEHDLRNCDGVPSGDLAIRGDHLVKSQPELFCDQVGQIMKDFQAVSGLFQSKSLKTVSSTDRLNIKEYMSSVRQKYSKVQNLNREYEHGVQTNRKPLNSPKTVTLQNDINSYGVISTTHERKAPLKIENYYFPGRQSRNTHKVSEKQIESITDSGTKNRLDDVKQVDSILSAGKREPIRYAQPVRAEESLVSPYAVPQEPKVKSIRGNAFPIRIENRPTSPCNPFQEKKSIEPQISHVQNRHKSRIVMQNPHRMQHSPVQNHLHPIAAINKKHEGLRSPPNTNRVNSPYNHTGNHQLKSVQQEYALTKKMEPVQQEYVPTRKMEPIVRVNTQQKAGFSHNIYQINQPSSHPPPHIQTKGTFEQYKLQQGMRPPSRIFSPQHCLQPQQSYARPTSRELSNRKNQYYSPQVDKMPFVKAPHINFNHDSKPRPVSPVPPMQEYFVTEQRHDRPSSKAVNFNNRYYCSGAPDRQAPIMTEQNRHPERQHHDELKRCMPLGFERPHSSSRNSVQKLNLFSNITPTDSQIESQRISNHLSSRDSSKLRPKSMNSKLHITMRRQR